MAVSYYGIRDEARLLHVVRVREVWDDEAGELMYAISRVGDWRCGSRVPREGMDVLHAAARWLSDRLRHEDRYAGVVHYRTLTILGWNTDNDGSTYVIIRED